MRRIGIRALLAGAAVVGLFAAHAAAVERRPLPPLSLVRGDSVAVVNAAPAQQSRWLIVYATPGNPACGRLLSALVAWRNPALLARVVVVIGASAPDATTYADSAGLNAADGSYTWYADPAGATASALALTSAPALVAVQNGIVEWSLSGVLNDPAVFEDVVRRWVEY